MTAPTDSLSAVLIDIRDRLTHVEELLASTAGRKRFDPCWLTLDQAASIAGTSKRGVQNQIRREREKTNGYPLRVRHGSVHRYDWQAFLEFKSQQRVGRGERIRGALEKILE